MAEKERYAAVTDVPINGPDPYTDAEKLKALEKANAQLEADVNEGSLIDSPEEIHGHAASAYATYILSLGPKSPGSATMGDLADEGSDRMNYTLELRRIYEQAVESIVNAPGDEGGEWKVSVWTTRDF